MRKLRRLRAEKGLTMDALEERTGVSKRTISELERGMRAPQALTLAKIARALGVDLDELLEEESPKVQAPPPLDSSDERGEYPYQWMSDALARLIDGWERGMEEEEVEGRYAHAVAIAAVDIFGAVLLMGVFYI